MVKRITIALLVCISMQAHLVQASTPVRRFVKQCLAISAGVATSEYLTDETIHRVANRLNDDTTKGGFFERAKAKNTFWVKFDQNRVLIYNGTRIVCGVLSYQLALALLDYAPLLK